MNNLLKDMVVSYVPVYITGYFLIMGLHFLMGGGVDWIGTFVFTFVITSIVFTANYLRRKKEM